MASVAEKNCKWHFAESVGGSDQGPTTDAKNEQFRKYPFPSLIRESIQNSLDVKDNSFNPVRVVFTFGSFNSANFRNFFDLKDHIKGVFELYPKPEVKNKFKPMLDTLSQKQGVSNRIHYLKVSDYNTKGMTYKRDGARETGEFYAFARCVGLNQKTSETSGGAFGIGKDAIFRISPLNTILVSSKDTQGNTVFQGVSLLCTHMYNGKKCRETGYYDNNEGYPVTDADFIPSKFVRDANEGAGTDLFLMGINPSKEKEQILAMREAVLRNFWLAIFKGELEIEFRKGNECLCVIDASNLEETMAELFNETTDKQRQNNYTYNPRPYYTAVAKTGTSPKFKVFQEKLPNLGLCKLYLNKLASVDNVDRIAYMNSINMLVHSKRTSTQYGFYAVFECLSSSGQKLLKRLENIAHNEWDPDNFRTLYNDRDPMGETITAEYMEFIKRHISEEFVCSQDTALDIMGAEDFLYYPEELLDADERDDDQWNYSFGTPTGETIDESDDLGTSITSVVRPPVVKEEPKRKVNTGAVIIVDKTAAVKDEEGKLTGGNDHPGGGNPNDRKPGDRSTFKQEREGDEGPYRRRLRVTYRTVAEYRAPNYSHSLIIHSPHDVENGEIEIITKGETMDYEVGVRSSNQGMPCSNKITGLNLKKGSNLLDGIVFEDGLKHALSITAYEIR